jgi:isoleucyl-tRNA synthetase
MKYPEYPSSTNTLEETILAQWREEDLFHKTLAATEGAEEFVFFEGRRRRMASRAFITS